MPDPALADRELRITPSMWPHHSAKRPASFVPTPGMSLNGRAEPAADLASASIASSVS
jgi:hypothetical protein